MTIRAIQCPVAEILPMRELYRDEMNCQIVLDSMCARDGWVQPYLLTIEDVPAGYALLAVGGPWTEKPTAVEYYVFDKYRQRVFDLFEQFISVSSAQYIETQTNATLLTAILHAWSPDATSEKIVFRDHVLTSLASNGAVLKSVTSIEDAKLFAARRRGCAEWLLELDGISVATGGICFHYNRPYGDIYMEVNTEYRRRGFGSYLVQELKRVCYEELNTKPCARCSPSNIGSRKSLQKAGFVPCAHILTGSIKFPNPA